MEKQQPTFHININDYLKVVGIQGFADAFIPAMERLIESGKVITVDKLLYEFVGNLQDDASDHWTDETEEDKIIKAEFNGEMLTYQEYNEKYGKSFSIRVEFYDWDEKKLLEPDLLYYVKLTVESSDYPDKDKLLAEINALG